MKETSMKCALVMCASNPSCDPRPNRFVKFLKGQYRVTIVSNGPADETENERLALADKPKRSVFEKALLLTRYLLRQHEQIVWSGRRRRVCDKCCKTAFDLVVCHDLELLPMALRIRKTGKVLFDAREFYPCQMADRAVWRLLVKPFNEYLCKRYLNQIDSMITVSRGLAREYEKRFGIHPRVIMSLPDPEQVNPSSVEPEKIRLVHHGAAIPSRNLETMIEMMDYVDERFSLDLMLVPNARKRYWRKLKAMANRRPNVRVIGPVAFSDIVPFLNQYDIGLYILPPGNLNLKYALPNKLFEFIQARLAVAIGPSVEMRKIVEQCDCGVVAPDFFPKSMAALLNELDFQEIRHFKRQAHRAAQLLNWDENVPRIQDVISEMRS